MKSPGIFLQTPFPHTLSVVKLHSSMSRNHTIRITKSSYETRHSQLTHALNFIFIVVVTFVTFAVVAAYGVLTPAVLTHSGKLGTLINIFPIHKADPFRAQLYESGRPWSRTRLTSVTPSLADLRTTAQIPVEETVDGINTLPVFIPSVALFLPYV